ncbi:ABC transporter permease [Rhodobacter maris]|uniref:Iron(III) transport system permease protein n=1 Tax=Rhodobacter maris TaxID=446682 RepID=A0A285SN34_9RHOB|nr:iron ABC transporter permease [Rhodobacter maris]SOC09471.1 iron(III) transport system permease protein [Rhodobacter maris]
MADVRRRAFGAGGIRWIAALVAFYLAVTALYPLTRLFVLALGPDESGAAFGLLRDTFASRAFQRALWNTLWSSAGSVVVSVVLGLGLALATGLMRLPGRALASFLALSPVLIPSQIMALGWIELMGPGSALLSPLGLAPPPGRPNPLYSGGGVVWLMGIEHMPLVFIAARAALQSVPADLVEAARIAGAGTARIVARVLMPLTLPAVAAGAMLSFAAAVGNFGVPALLGIPGRFSVLTTLIYQRLNGFGPAVIGKVAAIALVLVALALAALIARQIVQKRLSVPLASGPGFTGFGSGRAGIPLALALWAVLGVLVLAPLAALLATALIPALGVPLSAQTATLANFETVLSSPAVQRGFANSFALSLAAAMLSALVAILLGWLGGVAKSPLGRGLGWLADAGFVVPGTVLGLAMILVYLRPLPLVGVSLYGSAAILLMAYLGRFLPLVLRPVEAEIARTDPALDEAARIAGVGVVRRVTRIAAPVLAPTAVAGAVLIFMTALNELTVSALLWSAGHETIGVQIFSMQYEGNSTAAAAISVVALALVAGLVMLVDRFGRRLPAGTLPWRAP